ncbi:S8 family serine peptidase [Saccharomonospora glauca]|uniref:Subtilisin-like serine protease n=1 Tax=Saccharomonospora glauca K62 TaxID=928724 RepID=I1D2Z0_9PSEU|nr:S8 family serine peptidase [Saccharomonospora glauca]EIE99314.1 subtilisin-like serine protease [Saccharomonospora glauca K62]
MRSRRLSCLVVATALFGIAAGPAHAQQEPEQLPEQREGCLPAPTATAVRTPWPLEYLRPRRVWSLTEGAGVTVAVVDTGVDADTPQLVGRVREGIDVTGSAGSADEDCLGHGTFVAGIIGAAPMEGSGFTGVAPAVTILPVRVATSLEADQPGSLTPERLATGIRRAVDAGADVVNVSASTTVDDAALKAAVDYAERRDVVLVASGGLPDTVLGLVEGANEVVEAAREFDRTLRDELRHGMTVLTELAADTGRFLVEIRDIDDENARGIERP